MTINPETDVVASSYDSTARIHSYTIARGGKRWTVAIPDQDFRQFGPVMGADADLNKARRRQYLAARLTTAMGGPADA